MGSIDVYVIDVSSPCRAVLLLCKELKLDITVKTMGKGDLKSQDFLKINARQTVPAICDSGFCLNESRSIMRYLVTKYAKKDTLYPRDPKLRAKVESMLDFDACSFTANIRSYIYPEVLEGKSVNKQYERQLWVNFEYLENVFSNTKFVCGDNLTIPDFSIGVAILFLQLTDYDMTQFPNVRKYSETLAALPYWDEINAPFYKLRDSLKAKTAN